MPPTGAPKKHSLFGDLIAWYEVQQIKKERGLSDHSATKIYTKRLVASGHSVTHGTVRAALDRIKKTQKLTPKERKKHFEESLDKFIYDLQNNIARDDEIKVAPWLTDLKREYISDSKEQNIKIDRKSFIDLFNYFKGV